MAFASVYTSARQWGVEDLPAVVPAPRRAFPDFPRMSPRLSPGPRTHTDLTIPVGTGPYSTPQVESLPRPTYL